MVNLFRKLVSSSSFCASTLCNPKILSTTRKPRVRLYTHRRVMSDCMWKLTCLCLDPGQEVWLRVSYRCKHNTKAYKLLLVTAWQTFSFPKSWCKQAPFSMNKNKHTFGDFKERMEMDKFLTFNIKLETPSKYEWSIAMLKRSQVTMINRLCTMQPIKILRKSKIVVDSMDKVLWLRNVMEMG